MFFSVHLIQEFLVTVLQTGKFVVFYFYILFYYLVFLRLISFGTEILRHFLHYLPLRQGMLRIALLVKIMFCHKIHTLSIQKLHLFLYSQELFLICAI